MNYKNIGIKAETDIIGFVIIYCSQDLRTRISRSWFQIRFRLPNKTYLPRFRKMYRVRSPTVKRKEKYKKTSLDKSSPLCTLDWNPTILQRPLPPCFWCSSDRKDQFSRVFNGSFTSSIFNSLQISRLSATPKFPQLQFQEIQKLLPEPADFAPKLPHQGSILQWNCWRRLCSRRRPPLDRFPPRFAGNSLL